MDLEQNTSAIKKVFDEASDFILIGLTGRTGSGCSTTAQILANATIPLKEPSDVHFEGNERRKYKILKKYIEVNWKPFHWLQVRSVITRYLLTLNYAEFVKHTSNVLKLDRKFVFDALQESSDQYGKMHIKVREYLDMPETTISEKDEKKQACFNIYFLELPRFSNALREHLHNLGQDAYTKLYQATGDNIRASGHPASRKFDVEKLFDLPKTINMIIKSARFIDRKEGRSSYIAIDAIRNPYEALFFKERYSDFYLVSINTNDEDRIKHLINSKNFSAAQIKELDNKEYPKTLLGEQQFTSQNIHKCIEFADIHLHNRRGDGFDSSELRSQVAWYIALMMHPGLVMPTAEERCMQFATGAKLNSGCISRQVGAVITDQNHSVQAVGWNSSPQGQVPCILRSAEDLIIGADKEAFSQYERNDGNFIALIEDTYSDKFSDPRLAGRSLAFCFKDVQNELEAEKNQVHTRSLHAEENAFLQIAKHGGNSIEGGILFTTASPCELCSKKAYQLGITKIIYVDPYPGIANKHILDCGSRKPKLILFSGAIGSAYHKLYQPFFSYKDELRTLLSLPRKVDKKEQQIRELQHKIRLLEAKISEN